MDSPYLRYLSESLVVELSRVGAGASNDHLGVEATSKLLQTIIVNQSRLRLWKQGRGERERDT